MKFACSECHAKYQIPDERVAGRKLKIRCRRCGSAISVRGDQLDTATTPVASPVAFATEWHVSIEGEQHGPYATEHMAGMLRAGQLGWETHVWHEGFADWKTADESDTLVRAVASLSTDEAAQQQASSGEYEANSMADDAPTVRGAYEEDLPTRQNNVASMHQAVAVQSSRRGGGAAAARVTYSSAAQASAYSPSVNSTAPALRGGASFAPAVAAPPPAAMRAQSAIRSPRVNANMMTAERNEDSVLFSARNLEPQASMQAAPAARGGYASGEGSGLIDIRALAALAHTGRNTAVQAPAVAAAPVMPAYREATVNTTFATEQLANQAGTFAQIDSLRPVEREPRRSSNAVPIAIVAGSAMIAAAAFLGVYMAQQQQAVTEPVAAVAPTMPAAPIAAAPTEPAAPQAAVAEPAAPEPEPEVAQAAEPEAEEAEPAAGARASGPRSKKEKRAAARAAKAADADEVPAKAERGALSAKAAAPEKEEKEKEPPAAEKASIDDLLLGDGPKTPAAAEPKAKETSKSRSIDELLDTAVVKKGKGEAAAAPASDLPEKPSRDDVLKAMREITDDVKSCADGQTLDAPTANVALTIIGATGKVQSVRVTGNQGAVGSCIAKIVRGASFPRFSMSQQTINYPFKLK